MTIRQEALQKLQESKKIDTTYCRVGEIRVKTEEKDLLMKQLSNNEDYLKVPISLFLSSAFWRQLKVESNLLCQKKKGSSIGSDKLTTDEIN